MIVELLKPWRRWDAGYRLERTAGAADIMIRRGIARAIAEKPPQIEQASAPQKPKTTKTKPSKATAKAPRAAKSMGKKAPAKKAAK